MTNRKRNYIYNEKQKIYSSPQLSIYEDKKGMQEWKVAEARKLILKCWQREILTPANPAKLWTRSIRPHRVKQANRGGTERPGSSP